MELEQLLETCPEYAKDLKLNMGAVLGRRNSPSGKHGHGRVRRHGVPQPAGARSVLAEASRHLDEPALFAARAAAAVRG